MGKPHHNLEVCLICVYPCKSVSNRNKNQIHSDLRDTRYWSLVTIQSSLTTIFQTRHYSLVTRHYFLVTRYSSLLTRHSLIINTRRKNAINI